MKFSLKRNIKKIVAGGIVFCTITGFCLPHFAAAHPSDELLHSYCTRLLVFEVQNSKKVIDIEQAYTTKEQARFKELEAIRARQVKQLEAFNAGISKKVADTLKEARGTSNDANEIEKITLLESEVSASLKKHDQQINEILNIYRSGINDAMVARKASFMTAKVAFKSKVAEILKQSQVDCKALTDVKIIFSNTTTSLKAAHEVFKGKIARLGTPTSLFQKLTSTRDAAIAKADEELFAELDKAVADFKARE